MAGRPLAGRLRAPAGDRRDDAVAVHAAHATVRAVGDQEVPLAVEEDLGGKVEEGLGGRPAVAAVSAGHPSVVAGGISVAPAMVLILPWVPTRRMRWLYSSAMMSSPLRLTATPVGLWSFASVAGPPSPANPALAGARDGGDDPGRVDAADSVVRGIGDEHVAVVVDRDAGRILQVGRGGRTAVAQEGGDAVAGDRGDRPVGGDATDPVIERIGDEDVPLMVERHADRIVQLCVEGRATVLRVAGGPPTCGRRRPNRRWW